MMNSAHKDNRVYRDRYDEIKWDKDKKPRPKKKG
jgi:hypothetical protein